MAIKPILFNSPMVRAILDGRKTATRREVKGAENYSEFCGMKTDPYQVIAGIGFVKGLWAIFEHNGLPHIARAPYEPGDVLWVRETWAQVDEVYYYYQADERPGWWLPLSSSDRCGNDNLGVFGGWRPSIHMPREAARIWLRVSNVSVERLQEIDEAGAEAEGGQAIIRHGKPERTARENFSLIWENTLKPTEYNRYGWDANPWVWVIEFERCEKPEQCDD